MAFLPSKYANHDVKYGVMENSENLTIGEVIIPGVTAGGAADNPVVKTGGGTTGFLLGSTMGFKDNKGTTLEMNSYAAASDNAQSALVQAAYLPLHIIPEWISDLSAAAETTDNSTAYGNFAVDSTGLLVNEASVVAFSTRTAVQLFSYGLTGKNTTQLTCVFFATVAGGL